MHARAASSSMNARPSSPSTFAISCGSLTVATVPCRLATRANSVGGSMLLSTCTWASTKPGIRKPASTGVPAGSGRTDVIRAPSTVTSAGPIERAWRSTRVRRRTGMAAA
jgi:hypothetical protein